MENSKPSIYFIFSFLKNKLSRKRWLLWFNWQTNCYFRTSSLSQWQRPFLKIKSCSRIVQILLLFDNNGLKISFSWSFNLIFLKKILVVNLVSDNYWFRCKGVNEFSLFIWNKNVNVCEWEHQTHWALNSNLFKCKKTWFIVMGVEMLFSLDLNFYTTRFKFCCKSLGEILKHILESTLFPWIEKEEERILHLFLKNGRNKCFLRFLNNKFGFYFFWKTHQVLH